MSLALIGCGRWGRNLARDFARLGDLAAIVETSDVAWAAAADLGAPRRTWAEVLADPRITRVAIAAPAAAHAELARQALDSGRDVYVEKPLALNLAEALSVAAAVRESGRILMVGHLLRYHPAFERLLAEVRGGALGRVLYVDAVRQSLGRLRSEEDVFQSLAPHDLSMILAVFDAEPVEVRPSGASFVTDGVSDVAGCDLLFAGGGLARVRVSWLSPVKEQRLTVVCEKGSLVFDDVAEAPRKLMRRTHRIDPGGPLIEASAPEYLAFAADEPLLAECRHFIEACRARTRPRTDIDEALAVQRVLDAVAAQL